MALLTDDQKMLQDTAAPFMAEEGAIAKQLRHWRDTGCTDGFGTRAVEAIRRAWPDRHLIPESQGGRAWARSRPASCSRRSAATSPPPRSYHRGGRGARAGRHPRRRSAGFRASSPARLSLRWRSTKASATRPSKHRAGRQSGRATASCSTAPSSSSFRAARPTSSWSPRAPAGSPGETDGLTLFAVERMPRGWRSRMSRWPTASKAARLTFDNVALDADAVVGEVDDGWAPLSRALNAGRAGAAAELVGVAAGAQRDDLRISEAAQAVRQADRRVPGAAAPRRPSLRRNRDRPRRRAQGRAIARRGR